MIRSQERHPRRPGRGGVLKSPAVKGPQATSTPAGGRGGAGDGDFLGGALAGAGRGRGGARVGATPRFGCELFILTRNFGRKEPRARIRGPASPRPARHIPGALPALLRGKTTTSPARPGWEPLLLLRPGAAGAQAGAGRGAAACSENSTANHTAPGQDASSREGCAGCAAARDGDGLRRICRPACVAGEKQRRHAEPPPPPPPCRQIENSRFYAARWETAHWPAIVRL